MKCLYKIQCYTQRIHVQKGKESIVSVIEGETKALRAKRHRCAFNSTQTNKNKYCPLFHAHRCSKIYCLKNSSGVKK